MKAIMNTEEIVSIEQIRLFLNGTQPVAFAVHGDADSSYRWIQTTLVKFSYLTLKRREKGLVMRYLMKITNYSRQQLTRLIKQYRDCGRLKRRHQAVGGFAKKYTREDVFLLAKLDELHETLSGPAT